MTNEQKVQILVLKKQNAKMSEIAKTSNVPESTVRGFLQKYEGALPDGFCKQCGGPIFKQDKVRTRIFCCDECRKQWFKEHRQKPTNPKFKFTCQNCQKEFTKTRNDHPKYCSHGCYIQARFGGRNEGNV